MARSVTVVKMRGKVEYGAIQPIFEGLDGDPQNGGGDLVIDMSEVESVSPGALGALLLKQTDAEQKGCAVKFAAASSAVSDTIESNGFASVFDTYESTDAAMKALDSGGNGRGY